MDSLVITGHQTSPYRVQMCRPSPAELGCFQRSADTDEEKQVLLWTSMSRKHWQFQQLAKGGKEEKGYPDLRERRYPFSHLRPRSTGSIYSNYGLLFSMWEIQLGTCWKHNNLRISRLISNSTL